MVARRQGVRPVDPRPPRPRSSVRLAAERELRSGEMVKVHRQPVDRRRHRHRVLFTPQQAACRFASPANTSRRIPPGTPSREHHSAVVRWQRPRRGRAARLEHVAASAGVERRPRRTAGHVCAAGRTVDLRLPESNAQRAGCPARCSAARVLRRRAAVRLAGRAGKMGRRAVLAGRRRAVASRHRVAAARRDGPPAAVRLAPLREGECRGPPPPDRNYAAGRGGRQEVSPD